MTLPSLPETRPHLPVPVRTAGPTAPRRGAPRALRSILVLGAALVVLPAADATVGEWLRGALLIDVDTSGAGSVPTFEDDPAEAADFFARRDTVTFVLAEPTAVGDLLALYHLSTSEAAREALREQLGVSDDDDVIPGGARVVLPLTIARRSP